MKISAVTIALFVFMAVVAGYISFYYDISSAYGILNITNTSNVTSVLDKTESLNMRMNETRRKVVDISSKGVGSLSGIADITSLFLDIPGTLLEIPTIIDALIGGVASLIGISLPGWFLTMLLSITVAFFVFALLAFVRTEP